MTNSVQTVGKIVYIEPNEFAAEQCGFHNGAGDNITWNPEDLSFSVDLQVIIPNRDVCSDAIDDNVLINILNTNKDENVSYKSFMSGDVYDPKNPKNTFLSDNFTNISYQELRTNKISTKEALGIQSIDIKFNNFFFPMVTMKLVDVRGASLMMPTEDEYRKSTEKREKVCQSFFNALFHFPAPRFALSVKGYYGTRCTFMLSVTNFNGNFNSQNGNFEITIDFIGHMYGVYSDLPFNYIMIAPYIGTKVGTSKYWKQQTSENGYFKYTDGKPIKTFVEFLSDYERIGEAFSINSGKYDDIGKLTDINSEISVYNGLKNGYDDVYQKIKKCEALYVYDFDDYYNSENTNDKKIYVFVDKGKNIELDETTFSVYRSRYEAYKISTFYDQSISEDFTDWPLSVQYNSCSEEELSGTIKEVYNKLKNEYGDGIRYHLYRLDKSVYNSIDKILEDLKVGKDQIIKNFSNSNSFNEFSGDVLNGFTPTIENVVRMVFAHIDTFMTGFYSMLKTIKENAKKTRTLDYYNVNKKDTDVLSNGNDEDKIFLPPFTAFFKDKERVYPSIYNKNLASIEELNFINQLFEGVHNVAYSAEDYTPEYTNFLEGDTFTYESETGIYDLEKESLYHGFRPITLLDYFYDENPYLILEKNQNNLANKLLYFLYVRFTIVDWLMNKNIIKDNGNYLATYKTEFPTLISYEVENFLRVFPNIHTNNIFVKELKDIVDAIDRKKEWDIDSRINSVNSFFEGVSLKMENDYIKFNSEKEYFVFDHNGNGKKKYSEFRNCHYGVLFESGGGFKTLSEIDAFVTSLSNCYDRKRRICDFYYAPIRTEDAFSMNGPILQNPLAKEDSKLRTIYFYDSSGLQSGNFLDYYTQWDGVPDNRYAFFDEFCRNLGDGKVYGRLYVDQYDAGDDYYEKGYRLVVFPKKSFSNYNGISDVLKSETCGIISQTFEHIKKTKLNGTYNNDEYVILSHTNIRKALQGEKVDDVMTSSLRFRTSEYNGDTINITIDNYKAHSYKEPITGTGNTSSYFYEEAFDFILNIQYSSSVWGYGTWYDVEANNYGLAPEVYVESSTLKYSRYVANFLQSAANQAVGIIGMNEAYDSVDTFTIENEYIKIEKPVSNNRYHVLYSTNFLFMPKSLVLFLGGLTWYAINRWDGDFTKAYPLIDQFGFPNHVGDIKFDRIRNNTVVDRLASDEDAHYYWQNMCMQLINNKDGENSFYNYFINWAQTEYPSIANKMEKCQKLEGIYDDKAIANELVCINNLYKEGIDANVPFEKRRTEYTEMVSSLMDLYSTFIPTYGGIGFNSEDSTSFSESASYTYPTFMVYNILRTIYEAISNDYNAAQSAQAMMDDEFSFEKSFLNEKNSCYYTLKSIYDKWIPTYSVDRFKLNSYVDDNKIITTGEVPKGAHINEYNSFCFKDSMNRNIGSKFLISPKKLYDAINTHYQKGENASVIEFITKIAYDNKLMFFALPVRTEFYTALTMKEIFTPHTIYDSNGSGFTSRDYMNTYVLMYTYESSKNLNVNEYENSVGMTDDAGEIADINGKVIPENFYGNLSNSGDSYNIPAFGVTFAKQNQSYFKNITLSMEGSRTTDYSIKNILSLAQNETSGDIKQPITRGQDMYPIFANRVYDCTVEMMGCMNIVPTMFFQLNNIPMFRGAYRIVNVTHHIENGSMTTKFVGTRVSKYVIPFNSEIIDIESLVENNMDSTYAKDVGDVIFEGFGDNDINTSYRKDITNEIIRTAVNGKDIFLKSNNNRPFSAERACRAFHSVMYYKPGSKYGDNSTQIRIYDKSNESVIYTTKEGINYPFDRTYGRLKDSASQHSCAAAVRQAIEDGYGIRDKDKFSIKISIGNGFGAKDYLTENAGYYPIFNIPSVGMTRDEVHKWVRENIAKFKIGDIAIMRANEPKKDEDGNLVDIGHICMLESINNGNPTWCSDYNQEDRLYCWNIKEKINCKIYIYRQLSRIDESQISSEDEKTDNS